MQTRGANHEAVVNLTAYREKKQSRTSVPDLPPLDAEETITEIAKYIVLIAQVIRRTRH